MARLKALKNGGFSFSSGYGSSRQDFRVSQQNGEVYVPDYIIAKEKTKIDALLSNGDAEHVTDTSRTGPRVIKVLAAELTPASATPIPLDIQGEPFYRVVAAYLVTSTDTFENLNEGAGGDFSVVSGELYWIGDDRSSEKFAIFFVE